MFFVRDFKKIKRTFHIFSDLYSHFFCQTVVVLPGRHEVAQRITKNTDFEDILFHDSVDCGSVVPKNLKSWNKTYVT